jgi:hypothetical protein
VKGGKIKVTRPDLQTGEVVERIVPASHFKPKTPKLPKLDKGRLSTPRTGRSVLYMHDHLEQEIVYWEAHANCLTRQERSAIAHGSAAVIRPIKPAWSKGDTLEAASRVWATVETVKWTKRGYRTTFLVRDDRPTLMRRTPKVFEPPELDEFGHPIKHTKEAIEAARIDGGYTQDPSQAVSTGGEGVGVDYHNVLAVKSRSKAAERRLREQPEDEALELVKSFHAEQRELAKRVARLGLDPALVMAPVAQAIAGVHASLSEERNAT